MAKSKKIEKEIIEQPEVQEEKKSSKGRPKKEEEKLPTASLKELEEQGSISEIEVPEDDKSNEQESSKKDNEEEKSIDLNQNADEPNNVEEKKEETFLDKKVEELSQKFADDIDKKIVEEIIDQTFELSPMALKYKAYLEYTKMTPEAFVEKYPNHKFIKFVNEIINWKVKTGGE